MHFREEQVTLSADIESMFSQVAVPEQDQSNSREVLTCISENELSPSLKGLDLNSELPVDRALGVA